MLEHALGREGICFLGLSLRLGSLDYCKGELLSVVGNSKWMVISDPISGDRMAAGPAVCFTGAFGWLGTHVNT